METYNNIVMHSLLVDTCPHRKNPNETHTIQIQTNMEWENTSTQQNIKKFKYNSPTSSAAFPHSGGISLVVDFLS